MKKSFIEKIAEGISFEMIFVEGGDFLMGSEEEDANDNEKPVHTVCVPDLYMGKYPVTQEIWLEVMGNNPSAFKGMKRPVEMVSFVDVQVFLAKLNAIAKKTYRLPAEAEWEYAAGGGQLSQGYRYAGSQKSKNTLWYLDNSYGESKQVGLKYPNELGLCDMSGNVLEWIEDRWHNSYYGAPEDGSAWNSLTSGTHVSRGGSWFDMDHGCRVSFRIHDRPLYLGNYIGFRLALSPGSSR